jgi:hypothetical protein
MKTFLEHCQAVCREAGIAGGESAITTVVSQSGINARIVSYVRQAWIEIQNRHQSTGLNWRWMRVGFTLTTAADDDTYSFGDATDDITSSAITRFRNWAIKDYDDPPKIYLQSSGSGTQTWLTYLDWNDFKYLYRVGTQNSSYPAHITINPQNQIVLGPVPNGIYIVQGDYMRGAQSLSADSDVPDLPAECEVFEDAIMFRALSKYGLYTNAVEAITAGEDGYATYIGGLENDQLSQIALGEPMA